MSQLVAGYRRPGISALIVVQDAADEAQLAGVLRGALPWVEEIVVLAADVPGSFPAELESPRIRVLRTSVAAWNMNVRIDRLLHDAAALATHEWSLWLPVHARIAPEEWRRLRERIDRAGAEVLSFRLPGDHPEHATYYRQTVWRTAWNLSPTLAGTLTDRATGAPSPRDMVIIDDLGGLPEPADVIALTAALPDVASAAAPPSEILIPGAPASGATPLARLLAAAGLGKPAEFRAPSPFEVGECVPRSLGEANALLTHEAQGHASLGSWAATVPVRATTPGPDSRAARQAVLQEPSAGIRVLNDGQLARTLPAWRDVLAGPACLVPVRGVVETARSLAQRFQIPERDAVRLWGRHMETLVRHLTELDVPSLFVSFTRMQADPDAEARRIAVAFGIDAPPAERWFDASRPTRRFSGDTAAALREMLAGEARPGEVDALAALEKSLEARAATEVRATAAAEVRATSAAESAPELPRVTVVVSHRGTPEQLQRCLDSFQPDGPPGGRRAVGPVESIVVFSPDCAAHFLAEAARGAGDGILLMTRSDVALPAETLEAHRRAHTAGADIAFGPVDWPSGGRTGDGAFWMRDRITEADAPFAEEAPASTSVSARALRKLGGLDATLRAGFAYVDLGLRARDAGLAVTELPHAPPARGEAAPPDDIAGHQTAAGRALVRFLEKHPGYCPRELLRDRVIQADAVLPQYDSLLHELRKVDEAQRGPLAGETRLQVASATGQLAALASVRGLIRSEPRAIRLLGRDLWLALVQKYGERWADLSDAEYEERMARNAEACRALEGRHDGATAFICGTSPQLHGLTDEQKRGMRDHVVLGVNDAHYCIPASYLLSAYYNRVAFARDRLDPSATVVHMRPYLAPPLLDGLVTVQRRLFSGELPGTFGDAPTLLTYNNVILGATHLAVILGARRLVYVGMELSTRLHFYSGDAELRRKMVEEFGRLSDDRYFGVDHEYERHAHISHEVYAKSAEVLLKYPNPFAPYDTAEAFRRYFGVLERNGIETFSTIEGGVLEEAGAPYRPLDSFLGSGRSVGSRVATPEVTA